MEWWKILGIVVVLLALFLLGYYFFQESAQNCYRKARRAHKKGEKAYALGDFDRSESFYIQANEYRKRARELE